MNPNFSLPDKIKEEIELAAGFQIRYPAACERLAIEIRDKINETIGVTTLKRLFGFVSDVQAPRTSTLDILARFCDYDDYERMKAIITGSRDSGFEEEPDIVSSNLKVGAIVRFEYMPDRKIKLLYLGNSQFRVMESENGSLEVNDIIKVSSFNRNSPLIVSNVDRNGTSLGRYTAGKVSGITGLYLEEP